MDRINPRRVAWLLLLAAASSCGGVLGGFVAGLTMSIYFGGGRERLWDYHGTMILLGIITGAFAGCFVAHLLPSRFSLRTLLIATTLIALVLGLVVWASR